MIDYLLRYPEKLARALVEHVQIVGITLVLSLLLATVLILMAAYSGMASRLLLQFFALVYSIPSLAFFAILVPFTGLGKPTAILVLTLYNQYLLLRNAIDSLEHVDPAVVEAATGMGMSKSQILFHVRFPLARKSIFAGIHLAIVSTIGIATIAASINAGGLGRILLDGLRTMNTDKILWGTLLSASLAILVNGALNLVERRLDN